MEVELNSMDWILGDIRRYKLLSYCMNMENVCRQTQKKQELLKDPTKIEEIQQKKFIDKLNHYNLPFKRH